MNGPAASHDIGAFIATKAGAGVGDLITAGGGGDNTEINTEWIDRQGFLSCSVFCCGKATITTAKKLTVAGNLQDASANDGTGSADYGDAVAATDIVDSAGDALENVTDEGFAQKIADFDLSGADQFLRWQGTPDLTNTATDTADISFIIILGGADTLPAS